MTALSSVTEEYIQLTHSRHALKADLFHFALQGSNLLIFGNYLTPQEFRDFEVVSQAVVVLVLKLPVLLYQILVLHLLLCQRSLLSLSTAYHSQGVACINTHVVVDNEAAYSASITNCVADRPGVAAVGSAIVAA